MKKPLAYDTETTGLHRHEGHEMFSFSTCDKDSRGVGTTEVCRLDPPRNRARASQARLDEIWSDAGKCRWAKAMHNARFDIGMTEQRLGRSLRGHEIHETMALSHIFQNLLPTHKLEYLKWEMFGYPRNSEVAAHRYLNSERGMLDCPEEILTPYQKDDAECVQLLLHLFLPKVKEQGLQEVYDMERRLSWTTLAIENRGVMVNRQRCAEMAEEYLEKSELAHERFRAVAGYGVSPSSSKQLQFLLYEKMKLPILKRTKKAKQPSTDAETLEALMEKTNHPVLDAILRLRAYSNAAKIFASYLDVSDDDGVIHPSIHPYAAKTGRESCSRPNLQNVSKETTRNVRYPIPARRVFKPKPGFVNFMLDYAGIEARILAHMSGDEEMIKIFRKGRDPHAIAAEIFFGEMFLRATGAVRKSLRDAAKNGVYRIGYGGGEARLGSTIGIDQALGVTSYRRFKARFPKYTNLNKRQAQEVRDRGFIVTAFGRPLWVPAAKPFAGTNYDGQGTAAGILKRAQNRVDEYFGTSEEGMILPIHDELWIQWPRKRLREAPGMLRDVIAMMVDFPQISVPLEVDVKICTSDWNSARVYEEHTR
jgi:DNA polymerase-1